MNSRDVALLKRLIEIFQHSHFSSLAISVTFADPLHSKWECSLVCVNLALKGEQRALACYFGSNQEGRPICEPVALR